MCIRRKRAEERGGMCQILPKGVVSVLGPSSSPASASTVSHICGEKEIPHIKVGPEETPRLQYLRFASVSLYPSNEDVSLAVSRILKSFNYPSASLICAKAECLLRLEELVRGFLISKETLSVRMLDDSRDPTPLLKEIRDDKVSTIIIDANASISHLILRKASELGMTSAFYKYILTTMDFPILHLDGIVEDSSNILGFSMFNTSHPFYPEFVRSLNMSWRENCEASTYPGPALSAALMFDAVHVVVSAVRELNRSQEIGVKPLACTSANIWPHGTSLMNYLRMVEYDGLTGRVEFNSKGQRTNYTLRILEKSRQGHREIGVWYSNRTLAMNATTLDINLSQTLANKTLVVTTILENPYVMRRPNFQALSGNERFEGFCVDMLRELAELLRFRYRLRLVEDGLYGAPEPNGSWTGMVGELINRKADLAVAAFTITAEREKVIDFSKPFMTLGISILYRVHMGRKPGYFSFLDPFSPAVWLFMLLAYLAVSCVLFLAARLSPYEWYNPHPCLRARPHILENQYTLGNSLWFPVGGFMQQGSEIMPRALSTRCVSGVWWAFTLIIISSYTANLAAFLTVQRMEVPVESADDLADQTNIEYGTIHAGSTMTFFQNSRYQTYQRMWNYMQSKQPSVFVKSTEEGIARVLNSRYAFLLESTMNEYHRRLNCNLTQIGGLLDTKGYGIGMPLGSPFRDEITLAILQLQENNRLEILKRKWWEGGRCPKEEDHRAKGLGMENIGGIFVVLICGLIIAVFVAVMEFIWSTRRSAESEETPALHPAACQCSALGPRTPLKEPSMLLVKVPSTRVQVAFSRTSLRQVCPFLLQHQLSSLYWIQATNVQICCHFSSLKPSPDLTFPPSHRPLSPLLFTALAAVGGLPDASSFFFPPISSCPHSSLASVPATPLKPLLSPATSMSEIPGLRPHVYEVAMGFSTASHSQSSKPLLPLLPLLRSLLPRLPRWVPLSPQALFVVGLQGSVLRLLLFSVFLHYFNDPTSQMALKTRYVLVILVLVIYCYHNK
ncbi:glutamate receptor ionotropic, kainate 5 isoform X3 [Pan troglodytes]|uniref:glutamate receptor ionotropic, kainate 5 isoform X3 n=1 Tax=Pan troglodytes TaxID=9598 RepID=UPI000D0A791A|nr:glutamate receptor ionotropic, kainate 5 isoform X3 [Pan troglodytes]